VTVLESADDSTGFLVDYEIRLQGVRSTASLFTHAVGVSAPSVVRPSDPRLELVPAPVSGEERAVLEQASRDVVASELDRRIESFRRENEEMYEAERQRLEKRFAFQQRYLE